MQRLTSLRLIAVDLRLDDTPESLRLTATDEVGCNRAAAITHDRTAARDAQEDDRHLAATGAAVKPPADRQFAGTNRIRLCSSRCRSPGLKSSGTVSLVR